jgi:hypothetical protein
MGISVAGVADLFCGKGSEKESMYTVSLFRKGKEFHSRFNSLEEARAYARLFWFLSPIIRGSDGHLVLPDGLACAFCD